MGEHWRNGEKAVSEEGGQPDHRWKFDQKGPKIGSRTQSEDITVMGDGGGMNQLNSPGDREKWVD